MERVTLSVFKADVGGYMGHTGSHRTVLKKAKDYLGKSKPKGLLSDFWVGSVGDDLSLLFAHDNGSDSKEVHKLAWDTFVACTETAERLKLHSPGEDILSSSFSGSIKGMGPCHAEMTFRERPSEPFVVFLADKCGTGAWNFPLFRMFADPFNTAGLVIDPSMHEGFAFEILDAVENKIITLQCPGDLYDLTMFLGSRVRFVVSKVIRRVDGMVAATPSAPRPEELTGHGSTDDPVLIVRCQNGLPAVGEVTEAFSFPHLVTGWLRGTYQGPLMPVRFTETKSLRFDGPPRVVAAGFTLINGKLDGPVDLFDDPAFDPVRAKAMDITEYMRRHGPFEPHRVPHEQMGKTAFPPLLGRLESRFVKVDPNEKPPRGRGRRRAASEDDS